MWCGGSDGAASRIIRIDSLRCGGDDAQGRSLHHLLLLFDRLRRLNSGSGGMVLQRASRYCSVFRRGCRWECGQAVHRPAPLAGGVPVRPGLHVGVSPVQGWLSSLGKQVALCVVPPHATLKVVQVVPAGVGETKAEEGGQQGLTVAETQPSLVISKRSLGDHWYLHRRCRCSRSLPAPTTRDRWLARRCCGNAASAAGPEARNLRRRCGTCNNESSPKLETLAPRSSCVSQLEPVQPSSAAVEHRLLMKRNEIASVNCL